MILFVMNTDPHLKAELTLENARLKRENDLIASAWYDLNSRIQSNLLLLQRRPEAPRTMIKQQRLAVGDWGRRSKGGM
jgi:protein HOOK3